MLQPFTEDYFVYYRLASASSGTQYKLQILLGTEYNCAAQPLILHTDMQ